MRIATWNVNSIRTREDRVLLWLREHEPDVLCMQETKVVDEDFPREGFTGRRRTAGWRLLLGGRWRTWRLGCRWRVMRRRGGLR